MKLLHLSDLHIGRRLMDLSLVQDQRFIFDQILSIMDREQPDAVLIAGDVYDRSAPSAEAMELLDDFLQGLADRGKPVLIIAGNHDSSERLSFARSFMARSLIHVSPVYDGHIEPLVLRDEYGPITFWLMPYVHPDNAARFFPDKTIRTAHEAAEAVIGEMAVDPGQRNVILSHQFIVGGTTSESERRSIGTLQDVSATLYDAFDYVALGHLHRAQRVGREDGTMRYSGTPLMYSRSEMGAQKTVTMVELGPKGQVSVSLLPLTPMRRLRLARGPFEELIRSAPEEGTEQDLYFVDLTDEDDIPDAAARLRERYPNLLAMTYDNKRTRSFQMIDAPEAVEEKDPLQLMQELYALIHREDMREEALRFVRDTMKKVEGTEL